MRSYDSKLPIDEEAERQIVAAMFLHEDVSAIIRQVRVADFCFGTRSFNGMIYSWVLEARKNVSKPYAVLRWVISNTVSTKRRHLISEISRLVHNADYHYYIAWYIARLKRTARIRMEIERHEMLAMGARRRWHAEKKWETPTAC